MQQLIRWEPFRDADDFFRSFLSTSREQSPAQAAERRNSWPSWMPAVDIRETDAEYCVQAEVPGLRREDLKIQVEGNVLTLQGERTHEREEKGERSHRIERFYGSFCRRFTLPADAEAEKVSAEYKDGLVSVHIPKRTEDKPQSREIAVS